MDFQCERIKLKAAIDKNFGIKKITKEDRNGNNLESRGKNHDYDLWIATLTHELP